MPFPRKPTIRDYVSDDILKTFLEQLPWQKDQQFGNEIKDVVKLDDILEAKIKIKKKLMREPANVAYGTISGKIFVDVLKESPPFEFENHMYRFWVSNFSRETMPCKKRPDKLPGFNVRKVLRVAV